MKCNQSRPGFELMSPCTFPMMITITPRASPKQNITTPIYISFTLKYQWSIISAHSSLSIISDWDSLYVCMYLSQSVAMYLLVHIYLSLDIYLSISVHSILIQSQQPFLLRFFPKFMSHRPYYAMLACIVGFLKNCASSRSVALSKFYNSVYPTISTQQVAKRDLLIFFFFIIQCGKARAILCPHQPPTRVITQFH